VTPVDLRIVPAALTAWAVTAVAIVAPYSVSAAAAAAVASAVLTAVAGWWGACRSRRPARRTWLTAALAVAVVGGGFGAAACLRVAAVRAHPILTHVGSAPSVVVTPAESPRPLDGGRVMFRGTVVRLDGRPASGTVLVFAAGADYARLAVGEPARFRAQVGRPTRRDLTAAVLTARGPPVLGRAAPVQRVAQTVRDRFGDAARRVLPPDQAAMLPALVLGDTALVPAATTKDFRTAGLTHLTAVSGANVTIVCGAVLLSAMLIGPRAAVGLAAAALLAFVVVVQPSASVLRAAVMGAITLLAALTHRRRQAVPALAATVLMLMVATPELAVDVGFGLSVSATAALIVVAPVWSRRLTGRGVPKPVADALAVAVAAQVVTAPLVAGVSGQLSLVSVLANLAAAPAVAPITVVGTAAAALCPLWPAGADLLIRFTGPEVWWLLQVARVGARLPAASVPVPSGTVGVAVVGAGAAVVAAVWHRAVSGRRDRIVR
jgi:competence protein ComEC